MEKSSRSPWLLVPSPGHRLLPYHFNPGHSENFTLFGIAICRGVRLSVGTGEKEVTPTNSERHKIRILNRILTILEYAIKYYRGFRAEHKHHHSCCMDSCSFNFIIISIAVLLITESNIHSTFRAYILASKMTVVLVFVICNC
jgi:hypothetical protein